MADPLGRRRGGDPHRRGGGRGTGAGRARAPGTRGLGVHRRLRSDPGAVFRALLAQAQHDPAFAGEFRSRCLDPQRRRDRALLERAVAAGRLPAGLGLDTETDQLVGPLYYRVLVSAGPVGEEFTDALADAFLLRHDGPVPVP
ncbi:TetR-like C-terminal domain-containing protein [Streptomyces sp. NPDC096040]|uniref:TetR-like C-terminal domain-containing protein n=1 Tax=Streptomyces sp. NPDC096040 TaxID=3155541 RepID=UPI00332A4DD3